MICKHEDFSGSFAINYLADRGIWMADIRVSCSHCGVPFHFVGVPFGLSLTGPAMVSVDSLELRVPIAPGARAIPLSGEFKVQM